MKELYNVSSSPHVRSKLNTSKVMRDVIISLLPAAAVGIYNFGVSALITILVSVVCAVAAEAIFDVIVKKPMTVKDGSSVVTGLLLALSLPAGTPVFVPALGSIFAVIFVKCLFGGLGKNFMNPALAGRCFLLICFGTLMTQYSIDGVTSATPLAEIAAGSSVSLSKMFLGLTNGVIGSSILALLIGGIYLWAVGGITLETPLSIMVSFLVFMGIFGGHGFSPNYLLTQLCGGGVVMGAFFMATDPVTSPVTKKGRLLFGVCIGLLIGLFRVCGSAADSTSYAIVFSNMLVPMIDEISVPKPFGYRSTEKKSVKVPKEAVILCAITLVAGVALSSVYMITKDKIEEQQLLASAESYKEVVPGAETFEQDEAMTAAIEALGGEVYGTDFGKAYINSALKGLDASGNVVGYVISATSGDGYEGNITLSVGLQADGTVNGIAFTELNETAGMGMQCDEEPFKSQFAGVNTDKFTLNKAGGSTADNEIDSVSGASTSSGAVVNAVNAALDFFAANHS